MNLRPIPDRGSRENEAGRGWRPIGFRNREAAGVGPLSRVADPQAIPFAAVPCEDWPSQATRFREGMRRVH